MRRTKSTGELEDNPVATTASSKPSSSPVISEPTTTTTTKVHSTSTTTTSDSSRQSKRSSEYTTTSTPTASSRLTEPALPPNHRRHVSSGPVPTVTSQQQQHPSPRSYRISKLQEHIQGEYESGDSLENSGGLSAPPTPPSVIPSYELVFEPNGNIYASTQLSDSSSTVGGNASSRPHSISLPATPNLNNLPSSPDHTTPSPLTPTLTTTNGDATQLISPRARGVRRLSVTELPSRDNNNNTTNNSNGNNNNKEETQPITATTSCSLLQLFRCQYFDMWLTMWYLNKYVTHAGVTDFLCNTLYSKPIYEIQFYLPQLCTLLVTGTTESMERFFLDTCSEYTHFAFQTLWHLQAFIDTYSSGLTANDGRLRRCLRLHELTETAVVNGRPPPPPPEIMASVQKDSQSEGDMEPQPEIEGSGGAGSVGVDHSLETSIVMHLLSKKRRSEYFDSVTRFVDSLTTVSDKVMLVPPAARQAKLRTEIGKINDWLPEGGVYVPIGGILESHYCIVRLPALEAFLLDTNSKTHTTYIVYFETLESPVQCESPHIHFFGKNQSAPAKPEPPVQTQPSKGASVLKMLSGMIKRDDVVDTTTEEPEEKNGTSSDVETNTSSTQPQQHEAPSSTPPVVVPVDNTSVKPIASPKQKGLNEDEWVYMKGLKAAEKTEGEKKPGEEDRGHLGMELAASFAENWESKAERIRLSSPYRDYPNWRLRSMIIKYDECRQELLASQLITQFQKIFQAAELPLPLHPMSVLVVASNCGFIETIPNAISLHQLHKHSSAPTLLAHFRSIYKTQTTFKTAQAKFCQSLAAYSIVTYLLQVKDRHNGNILLLDDGRIIHIDFGYFLSNSPRSLNFEASPFKLTQGYVDVMGGLDSDMFQYYKSLMLQGFLECRKHMDKIILIVEMALKGTPLPCFTGSEELIPSLRERFQRSLTDEQFFQHVVGLIGTSLDNFYTRAYDKYQYLTRGILY
eukprot:TRINITY_DN692_c3_g2_i1.p1 TRINITY_DN692_c3_g2~~TRINITY_DN692_c3_g2_i1.p1  ORF type:complete len:967 (+),score=228.80 TRINITY_DN692_c3_g2_i1:163-3063(+)